MHLWLRLGRVGTLDALHLQLVLVELQSQSAKWARWLRIPSQFAESNPASSTKPRSHQQAF